MKTWTEIRDAHDPDGTKHDLTFKCPCGATQTCRCSKPKTVVEGLCDKCAEKSPLSETTLATLGAGGGRYEVTAPGTTTVRRDDADGFDIEHEFDNPLLRQWQWSEKIQAFFLPVAYGKTGGFTGFIRSSRQGQPSLFKTTFPVQPDWVPVKPADLRPEETARIDAALSLVSESIAAILGQRKPV